MNAGTSQPAIERGTANDRAGASPSAAGCDLDAYAASARIPRDFLVELGLCQTRHRGRPAVDIPYDAAEKPARAARPPVRRAHRDGRRARRGEAMTASPDATTSDIAIQRPRSRYS